MHKIFLTVAIFTIIILPGCGLWPQKNNLNENTTKISIVESKKLENFVYTNDKYNFSLTLPIAWKQLETNYRTIDWGAAGISDSMDFGLPGQKSLFNILFIPKETWDKNLIPESESIPIYLGKKDNIVFAFTQSESVVNPELSQRYAEIINIRKTFKLNN